MGVEDWEPLRELRGLGVRGDGDDYKTTEMRARNGTAYVVRTEKEFPKKEVELWKGSVVLGADWRR